MEISVQISVGELIDKWTILLIKQAKLTDPKAREHVEKELDCINEQVGKVMRKLNPKNTLEFIDLINLLRDINGKLWGIEDDIRKKHNSRTHDQEFIDLAIAVFTTNQGRSDAKGKINKLCDSFIVEQKQYAGE